MTQPVTATQLLSGAAYTQAVADIRTRLLLYGARTWAATQSFDQADLALMVSRIVPAVTAGQMQVANLTAAFFARTTGRPPVEVNHDFVTGGRGVPATTVYARPVVAARTVIAKSQDDDVHELDSPEPKSDNSTDQRVDLDDEDPVEEARAAGARRLESLITTDLQMAKIRQSDLAMWDAGYKRYRRVPTSAAPCAMCLIASTQVYKVGNLLPIHPGCQCEAHEIPTGMKLDDLLDTNALLTATHAKVQAFAGVADRGGRAVDYRKLLITRDHGELGNVIAWRGEKFTGPTNVGRGSSAEAESKTDIARRHLPGLAKSLESLRAKGLSETSPQVTYHLNQIARFTSDLNS